MHGGAPGPAWVPPRQIPLAPREFVNRRTEVRLLHEAAAPGEDSDHPSVVVMTGSGGVGKTVLAIHYLDGVDRSFPDGQLYADLGGFSGGRPKDPGEVLDAFLRSLDVADGAIPADTGAKAALFRSRTRGRRLAIMLDNAASAAQARALLPGPGRHLVLVTTRLHLSGLLIDGAEFIEVGPLPEDAAAHLLGSLLPDGRPEAEPRAVRALVGMCGGLPIAICAAASQLARRPGQPIERLVARLSGDRRLASLSKDEELLSVRSVFDASYLALSAPTRRLYRALALFEGRGATPAAAAALLGTGLLDAEDLVDDLVSASLLEEPSRERYRQHDLTRLHARERWDREEAPVQRDAAIDRLLSYYLRTGARADLLLNPGRWHVGPVFDQVRADAGAPGDPDRGAPFDDRASALEWLEAELENFRAWVLLSHATGRHAVAWQLCEVLRTFFTLRKHYRAWAQTHEAGLDSARAAGDTEAEALMLTSLGSAAVNQDEYTRAAEYYSRALDAWETAGHLLGQASALNGLGVTELARNAPRAALPHFSRVMGIHRRLGRSRGIALTRRRLGEVNRDLGNLDAALDHFQAALDHFDEAGEPYLRVRTLVGAATTHARRGGGVGAAERLLEEALVIAARIGADSETAGVLVLLADTARHRGDRPAEREHLVKALGIYHRLAAPQAASTARRLAGLDGDSGD